MIDIHSHILPGLDDGPEEFDTALEMVRMAAEAGTTDIVATPHSDLRFRFEPAEVSERISALQTAAGSDIRIHRGCDFHLHFENVTDSLENPGKYTINGRRYLLVEFADSIPSNTLEILQRMQRRGIVPVITHPERNRELRSDMRRLTSWVGNGCALQLTAQSFLGGFGRSAARSAADLVKNGLAHFVASDGHDLTHRPPILRPAYEHIMSEYGQDAAHALFEENPRAALRGDDIRPVRPVRRKRFGIF